MFFINAFCKRGIIKFLNMTTFSFINMIIWILWILFFCKELTSILFSLWILPVASAPRIDSSVVIGSFHCVAVKSILVAILSSCIDAVSTVASESPNIFSPFAIGTFSVKELSLSSISG